jgi:hypothetical protein
MKLSADLNLEILATTVNLANLVTFTPYFR